MESVDLFIDAVLTGIEFHFRRFGANWIATIIVVVVVFGGGYGIIFSAPLDFPSGKIITITKGEDAGTIATDLDNAHIIQHASVLKIILRLSGSGQNIHAGAYRFIDSQNVLTVARRLMAADYGIEPAHITFPEGITARVMALRVTHYLPEISASDFISAAQPYEGYLFPDTYIFAPDSTAETVVARLRAQFIAKFQPLTPALMLSGHSENDAVIMASIVEREARSSEAKKMVAGILWNRIKKGMPLQVDAVFGYINGRATYSPSLDDLANNSPYNTYRNKGLPPGPISNPGYDSLDAAINPTPSDYLYYLTGKDGQMHYAKTFEQHKINRIRYLD